MAERLVNVDRSTPMLLPPDLREWVPEDDMVHFVIEAVQSMKLSTLKYNRRGSGSAQYPPRMMLALLIYCYANGLFSSRRIERATHRDVGVRYLTADTHPDHDTICTFRRENFDTIHEAFVQVLRLARQMGVLKVGTASVDGTHILANASKNRTVRYDRAVELEKQLEEKVKELLAKAEQADQAEGDDGQRLPKAIAKRERLREQLQSAIRELETKAKARAEAERAAYERKLAEHEERKKQKKEGGKHPGRGPKPPSDDGKPKADDEINLTDADSRRMRKSHHEGFKQSYNAQAAVDADGSMLVLSNHVVRTPADFGQLEVAVEKIDASVGEVKTVLADGGYAKHESIEKLEASGVDVYVAVTQAENKPYQPHDLQQASQEAMKRKPPKPPRRLSNPTMLRMQEKLQTKEGRQVYAKRHQSVEPVFGIIKHVMGFDRFLLRGMKKVSGEWSLVTLAYNMKRLWRLKPAAG